MVTSLAQDQALRQSLEATGQRAELVGVEWAATMDVERASAMPSATGLVAGMGSSFAPSVTKPGEGGAAEVCAP